MGFTLGQATIQFNGNAAGLNASVASIRQRLGAALSNIGYRSAWAFGILAAKTGYALHAAAEMQRETSLLASQVRATGGAAGFSAEQLIEYANGLKAVTAYGREELYRGLSIMLTFPKVTGDMFKAAYEASVDMAAVMDRDIKTSVIMIGKAMQDPTVGMMMMRRVGVNITRDQQKMIANWVKQGDVLKAQRYILAELNREFGGAAKAIGSSLFGRLTRLRRDLGHLFEDWGMALVPLFNFIEKGVRPALVAVTKWIEGHKALVSMFTGLALAATGLGVAFGAVSFAVGALWSVIAPLIGSLGLVLAVIAALGKALWRAAGPGQTFADKLVTIRRGLAELWAWLSPLVGAIVDFSRVLWNTAVIFFEAVVKQFKIFWGVVGPGTESALTGLRDVIVTTLKGLAFAFINWEEIAVYTILYVQAAWRTMVNQIIFTATHLGDYLKYYGEVWFSFWEDVGANFTVWYYRMKGQADVAGEYLWRAVARPPGLDREIDDTEAALWNAVDEVGDKLLEKWRTFEFGKVAWPDFSALFGGEEPEIPVKPNFVEPDTVSTVKVKPKFVGLVEAWKEFQAAIIKPLKTAVDMSSEDEELVALNRQQRDILDDSRSYLSIISKRVSATAKYG